MAALIKLGSLITDISGKVGGQSFASGRGGAYIKNIGSYVNNRSSARQQSKSNLTSLSGRWRSLSFAARNLWKAAAETRPYVNRLGDTRFMSGFNLFVQYASNLNTVGSESTSVPGPLVSFSQFEFDVETCNPSEIRLSTGNIESNEVILISATPCVSVGSVFSRKRIKQIGQLDIDSPDLQGNFIEPYVKQYGVPITGMQIYFEARVIDKEFGSAPQSFLVKNGLVTFL